MGYITNVRIELENCDEILYKKISLEYSYFKKKVG